MTMLQSGPYTVREAEEEVRRHSVDSDPLEHWAHFIFTETELCSTRR